MSAQKRSRAFQQGRVKALRRMKQPMVLHLEASAAPRNPVARALAARGTSAAAGKHIRSQGAQRRADRVALQRAVRRGADG
ncbi:hypothetical protein [Acidovorax sp. SUPP2825]|uniref:hypothetical protein n=1 Tax=Acidovorax sp. SUPP2825 TaxID=2920879 RepID=UPI0023DE4154|nr:hypothetical protein [Acidovorax sp. SUPP2825]GKS96328.1 hypothetical protein AVAK2825_17355 [Acidovorax sp. SUPP2825]